jgi:hypothetical protein
MAQNRLTRRLKRLPDGRAFINLGCGHHAHPAWNNLDFSIYARMRRRMAFVRGLKRIGIISTARFNQFALIPEDVIVRDLRHGIPFEEGTTLGRKSAYHFMFRQ